VPESWSRRRQPLRLQRLHIFICRGARRSVCRGHETPRVSVPAGPPRPWLQAFPWDPLGDRLRLFADHHDPATAPPSGYPPWACSTTMALVCRKTCGETRFFCNDAHACAAVFTCFWRIYLKPERVIGRPRALTNSAHAGVSPRTRQVRRKHIGRQCGRVPAEKYAWMACCRYRNIRCNCSHTKGYTSSPSGA
jgi:hypothetical protein